MSAPAPEPSESPEQQTPDVEAPQPDVEAPGPETEQPVQPADVVSEEDLAKVIELRNPNGVGALSLRPGQTSLDANQRAALVAIGIDVQADPQVEPHIRPFMHMCQYRKLDPWAKEVYLIGRGKGSNRKYTMQTGIDGYRKMAGMTKRFIRVKDILWTGAEDDDRSYRPDADGVMRRVWYDQWPASRGYPGAAKAIIEHYDEYGNVVTTAGVADWEMYAPFTDDWDWHPSERGKKVYKTNPDGSRVRTLNDMWAKGYAHMLGKCAEALAHRKAFPATMSGVYTHEEMHRSDQADQDRLRAEQRSIRQRAYAEATAAPSAPLLATPQAVQEPQGATTGPAAAPGPAQEPQEAPSGPLPVGPDVQAVTDRVKPPTATTAETQQEWLRGEFAFQAEVLGVTVARLATRQVRALRKNYDDFTLPELQGMVVGMRATVVARMRETYDAADTEKYAAIGPDDVVNVIDLFVTEGEVVPEDSPDLDADLDADPEQPHRYVADDDGLCGVCGGIAVGDDPLHPA